MIAEIKQLYKDMGLGEVSIVHTDIAVEDQELKEFIEKSVRVAGTDTAEDVIAKVKLTTDFWKMTKYTGVQGWTMTPEDQKLSAEFRPYPDDSHGPRGPRGPRGPCGPVPDGGIVPDSFALVESHAPHDMNWTMRDSQKNVAVMFNAEHAMTVVVSPEIAADVGDLVPGFVVIKKLYVFPELHDDFKTMFHAKPVPDREYAERRIDAYSTLHGLADAGTVDTRRMVQQIISTRFRRTERAEDNLPSECLADSVVWALGEEDLNQRSEIYTALPAYFHEMGLKKNDKGAFVGIRYLSATDPVVYALDAQRQVTYDKFVSAA